MYKDVLDLRRYTLKCWEFLKGSIKKIKSVIEYDGTQEPEGGRKIMNSKLAWAT